MTTFSITLPASPQKLLRGTLSVLHLFTGMLVFTSLANFWGIISWQVWVGFLANFGLIITYGCSILSPKRVNKWVRSICITVLAGFLLYFSSKPAISIKPFDCPMEYKAECIRYSTWMVVGILAPCLTIIEVLYTLCKGPLENQQQSTVINSTSAVAHPYLYGVQPNVAMPYGQPQYFQPPTLQQPGYMVYNNNSVAPTTIAHAGAVPLQQLVQQSTFKHEDLSHVQPQQMQYTHPYSGGYAQPAPIVTSIPQSGGAAAAAHGPSTGRVVSGVPLASPVLPIAASSSPDSASPATQYLTSPSPSNTRSVATTTTAIAPSQASIAPSPVLTPSQNHTQGQ